MKSLTLSTVIAMLLTVSAHADPRLKDLGELFPGPFIDNFPAMGINSRGEVIANGTTSSTNLESHAFYYRDGAFHSLGSASCIAASINDAGQIVGSRLVMVTNILISIPGGTLTTNVGTAEQPIIFRNGAPVNLFPGTNANYGDAMGINDSGEIVGSVSLNNGPAQGFAYQNGLTTELGISFVPTAVNNRGDIAGQSFDFSLSVHPVLYHDGLTQDLGTLGGTSGSAAAINDFGEIAGWSYATSNLEVHAFLYRRGQMQDLGILGTTQVPGLPGGPSFSSAYAINDWGDVVGASSATNGEHAFLYMDHTLVDLNDLVRLTRLNGARGFLELTAAYGINDRGEIVGEGAYWDGKQKSIHGFLLDLQPWYLGHW